MDARLDTEDWRAAFRFASPSACEGADVPITRFARTDVDQILAIEDGEYDESDWIGVFHLRDGRFASLDAGCTTSGWGSWDRGTAEVADTFERIVVMGLTADARARLKDQLIASGADAGWFER